MKIEVKKIAKKFQESRQKQAEETLSFLVKEQENLSSGNVHTKVSTKVFIENNTREIEALTVNDKAIFELLAGLNRKTQHLFQINNFKINSYIKTVLSSLGRDDDLSDVALLTAPLARSVYEIVAVECYLVGEIKRKWANTLHQKTYENVSRHLQSQIKLLTKGYERTNIAEGIRALANRQNRKAQEQATYDFFCEYVHPNQGTNKLFNEGDLGEGLLKPNNKLAQTVMLVFLMRLKQVIFNRRDQTLDIMNIWLDMKSKLERLTSKKYTIENLFAPKKPKVETGRDGSSKPKAIRFVNADNYGETMQFQYLYLKDRNLQSSSQRVEYLGETMFDIHSTEIGEVFFEVGKISELIPEQERLLK